MTEGPNLTEETPQAENAVEDTSSGQSYFTRHWRGELSLPVSYWVNGFGIGVAYAFLIELLVLAMPKTYAPWPVFFLLCLVWSGIVVLGVWQFVGIWRSSNHHTERGGLRLWGVAAKVMVVIGAIQMVGTIAGSGVPQIRETYLIAIGDPEIGPYAFALSRKGTVLTFKGGITFGTAKEMKERLAAAPDVWMVVLDSHGGRAEEAKQMQDLIRSQRLDTYVRTKCLSACTIVYLGGRRRYLHREGQLGFHAASFPGVSASEMASENRLLADEAVALGVSAKFARKAYLWPADSMWYPTVIELINVGVVTRVIDFGDNAI
jgi:hypothetical protein